MADGGPARALRFGPRTGTRGSARAGLLPRPVIPGTGTDVVRHAQSVIVTGAGFAFKVPHPCP
ncbi:hypothetical protein [Streptomyces sp. NPDC059786]|uniref:hypothetical protein n=1 Tax=Streptomyces sp. NPDC059786 TaxID=3346946 RepID=UPI003653D0C2